MNISQENVFILEKREIFKHKIYYLFCKQNESKETREITLLMKHDFYCADSNYIPLQPVIVNSKNTELITRIYVVLHI